MWHWLSVAFSTYILHVEHGNGYQWWSGFGGRSFGSGAVIAVLATHWKHVNCHHKRCPRRGHPHPEYGLPACRKHWDENPHEPASNHLRK